MGRIAIQELASVLAGKNGMTKLMAHDFVTTFFTVIQSGLETDGLVKVKGLGTFKITSVDSRESVNVNTGERVFIDGHQKISFIPDVLMKEMVNKPFSGFETVVLNDGIDFEETADEAAQDDELIEEEEDETLNELEESDEDDEQNESDDIALDEEDAVDASAAPLLDFDSAEDEATAVVEEEMPQEEVPVVEEPVVTEPAIAEEETEETVQEESEVNAVEEPEETAGDITEEADDDEEVQADVEEEAEEEKSRWPLWTALAAAACLLSFGLGYWVGKGSTQPVEEPVAVVAEQPKPATDTLAAQPADTLPKQAAPEKVEPEKEEPKAAAPEKEEPKQAEPGEIDNSKYEAMDARIRTGAYRIVGTESVVKVRPGMTFKKIARSYIGEELACYIAAYNDMKENDTLTVGQEIKIPKLEWKKKKIENKK